ncbi:pectate lyase L [Pseudomassariella vexata]|uniref:Pectate lyase L n=1 Tax=Pseudomassariella vexata TaxID=1141098 RepID=A0A1Y2DXI0_9PEZI|nr:pectate lyase L [Pseudomassariella vexata]ORY64002.1 pectate lyase L [Pseudomassariella vexata]
MYTKVFLLAGLPAAFAAEYYVSPSGSGTGTLASPFGDIQEAVTAAAAGDTIYLRAGTYKPTTNIQITKSGTASAPITLTAYGSEKVIIDGEALPYTPADLDASVPDGSRGVLHIAEANYWKFYKLEIINGPYGVYSRDSGHNYYELISTHDNYESGFQIQGAAEYNEVVYLDSYRNRDPRKNGESADGFALKEGTGEGNIIRNARLWDNVDDGLDLWEFKSKVTIVDTISWANGFNRWGFSDFQGDGNGFKLGGGDAGDIGPANHNITNCIAFGNAAKGFTDNSQTGSFTFSRNTAWSNTDVGFNVKTAISTLKANIAAVNKKTTAQASQVSLSGQTSSGNSWDSSTVWTNSSFKSVDISLVTGARGSSGIIGTGNFLLPTSGSAIGAAV